MNKIKSIAGVLLAVGLMAGCEVPEDTGTKADEVVRDQAKDKKEAKKDKSSSEDKGPAETVAQENARKSAESYLDTAAFSRVGLIKQLKFEGFSEKDAAYGVDAQRANWMDQAAASAQAYLDTSSFSREGLIQQLKFEGFTEEQAVHGVNQVGL
jgi:hypothetical protein